jgi:hypothetical protein
MHSKTIAVLIRVCGFSRNWRLHFGLFFRLWIYGLIDKGLDRLHEDKRF